MTHRISTHQVAVCFCSAFLVLAVPAGAQLTPVVSESAAEALPVPLIHVEKLAHDFGEVWSGPDVEHTFVIHNRGQADLEIRGVKVDCGCTIIGDYPKVIAPGESGRFPFGLRTAGLNGKIAPKKVIIRTNDPATPQVTLQMGGTFRKRIEIRPAAAGFGVLITPESKTRTVRIKNNADEPLELKLQPFKSEQFEVELTETEPGKEFELEFKTVVPYKPGVLQALAVLETNLPGEPSLRIRAAGRVPDRLDLNPSVARAPVRTPAGRSHGVLNFHLNNYGASLVNVKQAKVDDPAITAMVDCRSPGKAYWIQVKIPPDRVIPPGGRTLTVETDDPDVPKLEARIVPPVAAAQTPRTPPTPQQAKATQTRPAAPKPAELMVGRPAPPLNLTTFGGQDLTSDQFSERITILNFVSPTCGFCKQQIPQLEKIRQTYEDKGVRFVNMVNTRTGRRSFTDDQVIELMNSLDSRLEIGADPGNKIGSGFHVTSYPTCVVVGKDGRIAAVNIGAKRVQLLRQQLDTLLAGKALPAATQPGT